MNFVFGVQIYFTLFVLINQGPGNNFLTRGVDKLRCRFKKQILWLHYGGGGGVWSMMSGVLGEGRIIVNILWQLDQE